MYFGARIGFNTDVGCYKMRTYSKFILLVIFSFPSNISFGQSKHDFLQRIVDTANDQYGYVNTNGDTTIPFNKYTICYTDKFYNFAIVSTHDKGIIGIDRNEQILFNVYVFDNGPDYPSNGLFRIVKSGKIGYADNNGNIIIQPQFDGAYPFKNGKAKVGQGCTTQKEGEHSSWTGGHWFIIDKKGRVFKK